MHLKNKYFWLRAWMLLCVFFSLSQAAHARLILVTEENEVNQSNFVINADDSEADFVDLEFGSVLTAKMTYDIMNNKFVLNEDLELTSDLSAQAGKHIVSTPWWNSTANVPGYIKLITPIVHNEGNMFSLKITGYGYGQVGKHFTIDCSGYAYAAGSLLNRGCTTIGTDLAVEIAKEDRGGTEFIVVRIGTPTSNWYYQQFSVEYRGWKAKDPDDFIWVKGETTPAPSINMNRVVLSDDAGTISTTGTVTVGDYTLPSVDGTLHQVLSTDGSGSVSWKTVATAVPFISTTDKETIDIGVQASLEFEGSNFTPSMTVSIPGFDGTIDSISVLSPTKFSILVTPGTNEATYDVVVTSSGNSNTDFTNNGVGLIEVKDVDIFVPGDGTTNWVRAGQTATDVATSLGKLVPTVTSSGWNKGASFGTIPANTNFTLEFNPVYMAGQNSGGYAMIGVDGSDPNWSYTTIDYAIYMQNGVNYYIYENGSSKGVHGSWSVSDTLAIKRTGTTIEYLKNGDVVYTSLTPSTSAFEFDSSIYRYLGAENIKVTY